MGWEKDLTRQTHTSFAPSSTSFIAEYDSQFDPCVSTYLLKKQDRQLTQLAKEWRYRGSLLIATKIMEENR
jgi:hypothetical protein